MARRNGSSVCVAGRRLRGTTDVVIAQTGYGHGLSRRLALPRGPGQDERMLTWSQFAARDPEMAAAGRSLLYQYGGVGLAFLGTVRADGGPRTHPMCPILSGDGLY